MKVLLDTNVLGVLCHKDVERRARAEALLAAKISSQVVAGYEQVA